MGWCVYALTKKRWKRIIQGRYFESEPVVSDIEERAIVQLSSHRTASITSENIDHCCPQAPYVPSLNEFKEQICTVCLGE